MAKLELGYGYSKPLQYIGEVRQTEGDVSITLSDEEVHEYFPGQEEERHRLLLETIVRLMPAEYAEEVLQDFNVDLPEELKADLGILRNNLHLLNRNYQLAGQCGRSARMPSTVEYVAASFLPESSPKEAIK